MKIVKTNIPDITKNNIDEVKINLSNKIISNIGKLLDSEFLHYTNLNKDLSESFNKLKYDVIANKNILQNLSDEYSRKKKQKELIDIIFELSETIKLANDSELKGHIKLVLRTIDDLKIKRLNEQINKFKSLLHNYNI